MLLDNKGDRRVGATLEKHLLPNSHLAILAKEFSVFGFTGLKKQLANIEEIRLLLSIDNANIEVMIAGTSEERANRNSLLIASEARDCANWLVKKAQAKSVNLPVSQSLFHITNTDGSKIARG